MQRTKKVEGEKFGSKMSRNFSSIVVSPPLTKHDVFLSFRGEDTRNGFTSHLYAALCGKRIRTYMHDMLIRGEDISPSQQEAIEESNIYVIIFSEHYASSTWCLDELTEILECKERYGRDVIPVFSNVDPSDVGNQRGSYADAVMHLLSMNNDLETKWRGGRLL